MYLIDYCRIHTGLIDNTLSVWNVFYSLSQNMLVVCLYGIQGKQGLQTTHCLFAHPPGAPPSNTCSCETELFKSYISVKLVYSYYEVPNACFELDEINFGSCYLLTI